MGKGGSASPGELGLLLSWAGESPEPRSLCNIILSGNQMKSKCNMLPKQTQLLGLPELTLQAESWLTDTVSPGSSDGVQFSAGWGHCLGHRQRRPSTAGYRHKTSVLLWTGKRKWEVRDVFSPELPFLPFRWTQSQSKLTKVQILL